MFEYIVIFLYILPNNFLFNINYFICNVYNLETTKEYNVPYSYTQTHSVKELAFFPGFTYLGYDLNN